MRTQQESLTNSMSGKSLLGQLSNLDVRLLRVFRVIVECGGMSAAELELNISRSAISRHLKDLEIRLGGLVLCRRGRAGFALTDEGRQIYNATLRLQAAMDSFRSEVNDLHERVTGNLTLAMGDKTVSNPKARIADALRLFTDRAPEVTLEVHVESLNVIESRVMDGTYQVGIVPLHRDSSSLDYYPLFPETMCLYCAPSHPLYNADHAQLSWQDLNRYAYVGLGYHCPNMDLAHKFKLRRSATAYDQEAIMTMIASGCYIGFLPTHYAELFTENSRIRRLDNQKLRYGVTYSGIVRRAPKPSRSVGMILECLLQAHSGVQRDESTPASAST